MTRRKLLSTLALTAVAYIAGHRAGLVDGRAVGWTESLRVYRAGFRDAA